MSRTGVRDVAREAVRARVAAVAVGLFHDNGFDEVTVEQIAAEVGISARSFHRYFPAKEDTVVGDPKQHRDDLAAALEGRPSDEAEWTALREAFAEMLDRGARSSDTEVGRRAARLITSTPSLRARNLEKHQVWAEALVPLVERRLGSGAGSRFRAEALVQAALGCFDVAIGAWAAQDGPGEDPADLLRRAFDTVRGEG